MNRALASIAFLAFVMWAPAARAGDEPDELVAGKTVTIKSGSLVKFVAKPETGSMFVLPSAANDPTVEGATVRFFDTLPGGAGDVTYTVDKTGWTALGSPPGSKGFRYKGSAAAPFDAECKMLLKPTVIKVICKGTPPTVPLTPPFLGNVGVVLTAGSNSKRYCAEFGGEPRKNDETLTKRTNAEKPPQCPSVQPTPTATTTPADTATLTPTPTATWAPGTTITGIVIQSGGLTRSYNVHIPTGYDGTVAVPLVLDLHGSGANGVGQETISGFRAVADANGFIVAYPDGEFQQWNAGVCCDPAAAAGVDDVGFARAVVADIASKANIDALRVYATGLSNGGGMTHRLACEAADVFAAAAPVAFPLALDPLTACQPVRPISVLHFAGLTDMIIPYDGGTAVSPVTGQVFTVPSAPASFAYWAATSGCGDGAPDMVEDLGNGASCDTYTTCAAGVEVGLCSIHGTVFNGHLLYANSDGVNVAQRAWDFMSAFTLPTE